MRFGIWVFTCLAGIREGEAGPEAGGGGGGSLWGVEIKHFFPPATCCLNSTTRDSLLRKALSSATKQVSQEAITLQSGGKQTLPVNAVRRHHFSAERISLRISLNTALQAHAPSGIWNSSISLPYPNHQTWGSWAWVTSRSSTNPKNSHQPDVSWTGFGFLGVVKTHKLYFMNNKEMRGGLPWKVQIRVPPMTQFLPCPQIYL